MLLELTSASRAPSIHCLDLRFMTSYGDYIQFKFDKLHKSWRKHKSSPVLKCYEYKEDRQLCVVTTFQTYVQRARGWRGNGQTQFLLGHIKPHKEVSSSTVSRWLKDVIALAGITNVSRGILPVRPPQQEQKGLFRGIYG